MRLGVENSAEPLVCKRMASTVVHLSGNLQSPLGQVAGMRDFPLRFQGNRRHVVEPWMGGDMWVIKAFTQTGSRQVAGPVWDH